MRRPSVLLAAVLLVASQLPAAAYGPTLTPSDGLLPLESSALTLVLPDGAVARGVVVPVPSGVQLRPEVSPSSGRFGVAPVRRPSGVSELAVVNGGYWLPGGVPNGPFVLDAQLHASETFASEGVPLPSGRGSLMLTADAVARVGRADASVSLVVPAGEFPVSVNVRSPSASAVVFTPLGAPSLLPGEVARVVQVPSLTPGSLSEVGLSPAPSGRLRVPDGSLLLVVPGSSPLAAAGRAVLAVEVLLDGSPVVPLALLPGAGLLVEGGRVFSELLDVPASGFEALSPSHRSGRHPRTAVAVTPDGPLLVVVDGRAPGWSSGVTLEELARLMLDLGASSAVNLDGGGSSLLRGPEGVVNVPSEAARAVANVLVVESRPVFSELLSGGPSWSTSGRGRVVVCAGGDGLTLSEWVSGVFFGSAEPAVGPSDALPGCAGQPGSQVPAVSRSGSVLAAGDGRLSPYVGLFSPAPASQSPVFWWRLPSGLAVVGRVR